MSYDTPKTTPRYCGNCGQKLLEGATFCAYCGTPVPSVSSTGVVSSKPSPQFSSMPPKVTDRGIPTYQTPYRAERMITDPPLPFIQHFQGVLTSPQVEMPRIIKRPNLKQPLLIVLIAGILAGLATVILYLKLDFSQEFIDDMFSSVGYSAEMFEGMDMQSLIQFSFMLGGLFIPVIYIIGWIIVNTLILWGLHAIISANVPSHERNFKLMGTITGWAYLPRIFEEFVNAIIMAIFIPQTEINSMSDLAALESFEVLGEFGFILSLVSILMFFISLIWGGILVYYASKAIDPEGSHAIVIVIIFSVIKVAVIFLLPGIPI
ncbi:MAG: zinc ribbon domain-containing protein [Promethearchaeota archaeon]